MERSATFLGHPVPDSKVLLQIAFKYIIDQTCRLYAVELTSKKRPFVLAVLQPLHETDAISSYDMIVISAAKFA